MRQRPHSAFYWTLLIFAVTAGLIGAHEYWNWCDQFIGLVGSYASLVGLAITAYVSISVANIKRRLISRFVLDSCMEKFEKLVAKFDRASTASDFTRVAAEMLEYVNKISDNIPKEAEADSPAVALQELLDCDRGNHVIAKGKDLKIRLIQFKTRVQLHRNEERLGRDDG